MEHRRFGEAYTPLAEPVTPSNAERRTLLEAPRRWMGYFSTMLNDFLLDGQRPQKQEFIRTIDTYVKWANTHAEDTYTALSAMTNASPMPTRHVESELNFHRLNRSLGYMWRHIIFNNEPVASTAHLSQLQAHLALYAVEPARRLAFLNRNVDNIRHPDQEAKDLIGHLTEVDTAIVSLELTKANPHIVTIPAPHQYERNVVQANADFLTFDTHKQQVRGLQVKGAATTMHRVNRYDPSFITVIDGMSDLGDTITSPSGRPLERFPGQIALGILSSMPIKSVPTFVDRATYLHQRQVAKELLHGRKSQLQMATQHIGYRVLHDLYRQPVSFQEAATA